MGRSEVAARWLAISICTLAGSAISDVGCHLATIIAGVDGDTTCGRRDVRLFRSFFGGEGNLIDEDLL